MGSLNRVSLRTTCIHLFPTRTPRDRVHFAATYAPTMEGARQIFFPQRTRHACRVSRAKLAETPVSQRVRRKGRAANSTRGTGLTVITLVSKSNEGETDGQEEHPAWQRLGRGRAYFRHVRLKAGAAAFRTSLQRSLVRLDSMLGSALSLPTCTINTNKVCFN